VLYRRLFGFARKARLEDADCADVATDIFIHICQSVAQCKALDEVDSRVGAAKAFNWVRRVFKTRLVDWLRKNRKEVLLKEALEVDSHEDARSGTPEADDETAVQQQAISAAREGIRTVIAAGDRNDPYFKEAKRFEVALSPPGLEQQLRAFDCVRAQGKSYVETARLMMQGEGAPQEQARIGKWVQRGRKALLVGARFARARKTEPSICEALDKLIDALSKPEKGRKS